MHDTLSYFAKDPVHRRFHHNLLTFGPMYAFTENFVLPLSHDEVVHGKRSLLDKMPGDDWQRFANLRLLLTFQWTYPGKKLLFMGGEFGQPREWNHHGSLPWHLADEPRHAGVRALRRDLNRVYRSTPALHRRDHDGSGFSWLSWQDDAHSVLSYLRKDGDEHAVVVLNFTPVPRHGYRVGVPRAGRYREILNSDSQLLRRLERRQRRRRNGADAVHGSAALDRRDAAAARRHRARAGLELVEESQRRLGRVDVALEGVAREIVFLVGEAQGDAIPIVLNADVVRRIVFADFDALGWDTVLAEVDVLADVGVTQAGRSAKGRCRTAAHRPAGS